MSRMPLAFPSQLGFAGENGPGLGVPNTSVGGRGPCWKRIPIPSRAPRPLDAKLPVAPMHRVLFIPHVYQMLHKRTVTCEYFS